MPARLSRSRRSVVFIIDTSAEVPEEPQPRDETVCLALLPTRLAPPLAVTLRSVPAKLVADRRRARALAPIVLFVPLWRLCLEFRRTTDICASLSDRI